MRVPGTPLPGPGGQCPPDVLRHRTSLRHSRRASLPQSLLLLGHFHFSDTGWQHCDLSGGELVVWWRHWALVSVSAADACPCPCLALRAAPEKRTEKGEEVSVQQCKTAHDIASSAVTVPT